MHAMDFYTQTCRCVMQADPENPTTLSELRRLLPCLRQALGCYVCFNLLKEPTGPNHNVCRHSVCARCIGGKMKLKPACSWCKDYWDFVPNPLLKVLVTCYKKLCTYIYTSPLGQVIKNDSVNGEVNHLLKIISEGMDFDDSYIPSQPYITNGEQIGRPTSDAVGTCEVNNVDKIDIVTVEDTDDKPCANVTPSSSITARNLPDVEDASTCTAHRVVRNKILKQKSGKKKGCSKRIDHSYENYQNMKNNTKNKHTGLMNRTLLHNKCTKKAHRLKSSLSSIKKSNKKRCKVKKFNTRFSKQEEPSELERIDNSEPPLKNVKCELPPPELKPLSLCNCGKSGNFSQLTCIGQRCPCYSMKLPCIGCKCRGCRNPKKGPDYQGMGTIGSSAVLRSGTRNTSEFMCVNS